VTFNPKPLITQQPLRSIRQTKIEGRNCHTQVETDGRAPMLFPHSASSQTTMARGSFDAGCSWYLPIANSLLSFSPSVC
jgi:hypothetical protein